jgi:hypothetical protein
MGRRRLTALDRGSPGHRASRRIGQIDLAFLATVAGHLRRCEKCWRKWADGETPVDLLTAAVRTTPAWEVFRPVVMEIHAQQGRGRRRGGK